MKKKKGIKRFIKIKGKNILIQRLKNKKVKLNHKFNKDFYEAGNEENYNLGFDDGLEMAIK